jgi:hypothetical protein
MSTQISYRKGTAAQNDAFTGALAEITVDTTNKTLRVHDGATTGGSNIATVAYVDNAISSLSANSITDGTSSITIVATDGNIRANVGGSTIQLLSSSGANVSGYVTATGNITGGNLSGTSIAGTLTTAAQTNITSVGTLTSLTSSGNIQGANVIATADVFTPEIVKTGSNGVGNIGQSNLTFNTVFAKATSAQYADLAEKYQADQSYPPGTVLEIGGSREVTETTGFASTKIAGVVSTDPAFIMNSGASGDTVAQVALLGRVPCRVIGSIKRGDLLCSSRVPGVATSLPADQFRPGSVIGKALADYDSDSEGQIEILVGRL